MYQEKEINNNLIPKGNAFLRDNELSFLFAGRDSSSTALAWFFWLIAMNPNPESKILEELQHVHAKNNHKDNGLKAKRPYRCANGRCTTRRDNREARLEDLNIYVRNGKDGISMGKRLYV
ncbi:hypothetical protein FRX31_027935 [Thalictrum thalictroides]|uniref:Cytochrome p450 n=1 Tax=Thalictrum thalictroides TaxID=46969 RepID=A0A7J6VE38_THATH|nr:hypothetical protein FRX31_027935 [Thalictrum thalictroides]